MSEARDPFVPLPPPTPLPVRPLHVEQLRSELNLEEILSTLLDRKWWILTAMALALVAGAGWAFASAPIYKADGLVQVEERPSVAPGLQDLSELFGSGSRSGAATEIELIRSRRVIASVVDDLRLDVTATPRHLPFFGRSIARRWKGPGLAKPRLGMDHLAWGGEEIVVERFEVPESQEGTTFRLVAREDGKYELYAVGGETVLLQGAVGERSSGQDGIEMTIAKLVARPGTEFRLSRLSRVRTALDLLARLAVSERGGGTGVITLSLMGENPDHIRTVLDGIMSAYVRQNIERRAEVAEKTLEFINAQLPAQKNALEEAERKLNEYQRESGKMDLSLEANAIVNRSAEVETALSQLSLERLSLRQSYTESHPVIVALDKKLEETRKAKRSIEADARLLPETELNSMRLIRDVKVANELFVQMLTTAQELRLAKSGTIGNVRVVDAAVIVPGTFGPSTQRILGYSLLIGLFLGTGNALLHRRLTGGGVEDPDLLERAVGLPVFASVPHSDKQEAMSRDALRTKQAMKPLARLDGADLAIESVRSLRTSLQFALASSRNNIVMIGGSRPGVGKSFIAINLAYAIADAGRSVVLIDGDLRKGQLHRYFGRKREGGFSELVCGTATIDEVSQKTDAPSLTFISSGRIPPNPSEILSSERFDAITSQISKRHDLVIIDAPPILAVTDAVLLARAAGVNLIVLKAGVHPLREITATVNRLQQSGSRPNGFVFNSVPIRPRMYGYGTGYGKYRYHYQYEYR